MSSFGLLNGPSSFNEEAWVPCVIQITYPILFFLRTQHSTARTTLLRPPPPPPPPPPTPPPAPRVASAHDALAVSTRLHDPDPFAADAAVDAGDDNGPGNAPLDGGGYTGMGLTPLDGGGYIGMGLAPLDSSNTAASLSRSALTRLVLAAAAN
ncbi:unnamed protein product [Miscanthus lutarioriparius]|uniref:Uncharacterized protein n=1 Tax=Miscanthus lutarioriparius TaxID=422564 RepID=A0A811PT41_9POAL|nr:unnamed protein product [Miscanthus lutarioriparius]